MSCIITYYKYCKYCKKKMGLKSVSVETKWQVIGMKKANLSNREIGRQLGISEC
jgi:hypothetical protein